MKLAFFLFALSISSYAVAGEIPPSAMIDSRYGDLLDNNPLLKAAGRISEKPGFSMLCGPAAFENALTKIRTVDQLPQPDPISDLEEMVPIGSPIIENGIQPADLKILIEQKLTSMGVEAVVEANAIGPLLQVTDDLRQSINAHTIVLMSFVWWPTDQFNASQPWLTPYETGHWIAASGYDSENPGLFYFQDTLQLNTVAISITPGYPGVTSLGAPYENEIIQYQWNQPYGANRIALMGSLITINFK